MSHIIAESCFDQTSRSSLKYLFAYRGMTSSARRVSQNQKSSVYPEVTPFFSFLEFCKHLQGKDIRKKACLRNDVFSNMPESPFSLRKIFAEVDL